MGLPDCYMMRDVNTPAGRAYWNTLPLNDDWASRGFTWVYASRYKVGGEFRAAYCMRDWRGLLTGMNRPAEGASGGATLIPLADQTVSFMFLIDSDEGRALFAEMATWGAA